VTALQAAEQRKAELLRALTPPRAFPADIAKLRALLDSWRESFRSRVTIARQILPKLLDGERVVFTPTQEGDAWEFVAPCTLEGVSIGAGLRTPQKLAAPSGSPRRRRIEVRGTVRVA